MKLTVLSEDTVYRPGLLGEHGLSMLVEKDGTRLLFDTGQLAACSVNADRLGMDLSGLAGIVLSHGHYDHTGGMVNALGRTGPVDVWHRAGLFAKRYAVSGRTRRDISIPWGRAELEREGARFRRGRGAVELGNGLFLIGELPAPARGLDDSLRLAGGAVDSAPDEQCLVAEGKKGLVVVSGCGHRDIVAAVKHLRGVMGTKKIHAVAGGMHLARSSMRRIRSVIAGLDRLGVRIFVPCHCTGPRAIEAFRSAFPGRVTPGSTGATITL